MSATTQTQRDAALIQLREQGHSLAEIAAQLGMSLSWAHGRTNRLAAAGLLQQPERIVGHDGKSYPHRHGIGLNRWRSKTKACSARAER